MFIVMILFLYSIIDLLATQFYFQFVNLSFLRLYKAARLVRLLQKGQKINVLLWTFVQSLKVVVGTINIYTKFGREFQKRTYTHPNCDFKFASKVLVSIFIVRLTLVKTCQVAFWVAVNANQSHFSTVSDEINFQANSF